MRGGRLKQELEFTPVPEAQNSSGGGSIKSLTNKAVPLLIGVLLAPAFLAPVQAQRTLTMGKLAILSPSHI